MGQAENEEELDNIWISENQASQWITNFISSMSQEYEEYINLKVTRGGAWYLSDEMSFWEFDYDTIWFCQVTIDGHYGPSDTLEHINLEYCLRGTKLLIATLATLTDSNMGSFPNKPIISGTEEGNVGEEFSFTTSSIDPYSNELSYLWDWDDGTESEWIGPFNSGEIVSASYSWDEEGIYQVKVKVIDQYGAESEWSDPLVVSIPKNKHITEFNPWIFRLIQRFPILKLLI